LINLFKSATFQTMRNKSSTFGVLMFGSIWLTISAFEYLKEINSIDRSPSILQKASSYITLSWVYNAASIASVVVIIALDAVNNKTR
jgi:hypothetical protein